MSKHHRLLPPASLRVRARLDHLRCGFCGQFENPEETGRVIGIAHARRAICELCIDDADVMAQCAALARRAPKATPGPRRLAKPRRIGADGSPCV